VSAHPASAYLAGGTTQVDLMLKDGIFDVERLVDITRRAWSRRSTPAGC
jgi:hypothetical protein